MTLVLDSSVTLAWLYVEETTLAIGEVASRIVQSGAWVPSLWKLEVANILELGVRRGRNDAAFRDQALADLALLPVSIDAETADHAWGQTVTLSHKHSPPFTTQPIWNWHFDAIRH